MKPSQSIEATSTVRPLPIISYAALTVTLLWAHWVLHLNSWPVGIVQLGLGWFAWRRHRTSGLIGVVLGLVISMTIFVVGAIMFFPD